MDASTITAILGGIGATVTAVGGVATGWLAAKKKQKVEDIERDRKWLSEVNDAAEKKAEARIKEIQDSNAREMGPLRTAMEGVRDEYVKTKVDKALLEGKIEVITTQLKSANDRIAFLEAQLKETKAADANTKNTPQPN